MTKRYKVTDKTCLTIGTFVIKPGKEVKKPVLNDEVIKDLLKRGMIEEIKDPAKEEDPQPKQTKQQKKKDESTSKS